MRFVVLDTETTGRSFFQGDRLIEIGACKYDDRVLVEEYHCYINPQCKVSEGALRVHGLSDQFLKDKQLFAEVADSFLEFISGCVLVIHNAQFDLGFLDNELGECGLSKLTGSYEVVDTLAMARKIYPGQRNNLDALCKRLGVDNRQRTKHGALLDARLLAEVYLIMTSKQNALKLAGFEKNKELAGAKQIAYKNFVKAANSAEIIEHKEFYKNILPEFDVF